MLPGSEPWCNDGAGRTITENAAEAMFAIEQLVELSKSEGS